MDLIPKNWIIHSRDGGSFLAGLMEHSHRNLHGFPFISALSPTPVPAGTQFKAVSGGYEHSLAIDINGNLWAWGRNANGRLSNDVHTAVRFREGDFIAIGAGRSSLAIEANGNLWAWGRNHHSVLGDGTTSDKANPVQINTLIPLKPLAISSRWHSLAVDRDGHLWAWGANGQFQLGNGMTMDVLFPVGVSGFN